MYNIIINHFEGKKRMFKSIFSKYIAAISLILTLSFVILATVLTSVIGDYGQSMRRENVEHISDIAGGLIAYGYPTDGTDPSLADFLATRADVDETFAYLCKGDSATVLFVIDMDRNVLLASEAARPRAEALAADDAYFSRIVMFLTSNISYRQTETVAALGEDQHIVYITPFHNTEGMPIGFVYAATSIDSVQTISQATIRTVVMACLWIMIAVLIAMYFITERHVNPLNRMSAAAKKYAKGDFSERVDGVVGDDEISELVATFNHMAEELENLEQKRNRFISDVSHELRSPMTSMLGFVEAVADGSCPPEKQSYYLSLVAEEIKRLSRLVADLLDVSRLEMGEKKMNFIKYDICDNAATVLISLEKRINDKMLDVSFDAEEDRLYVSADADAMYRVLYNLIENAVKFSRKGGKLTVSLAKDHENIRVSVYNQGIGIPKEDIHNVFDRFYKSDKSRGEDKKGVGLGLYFVKTIVTAHGGTIDVESEEGEYCLFTATLPRYEEHD